MTKLLLRTVIPKQYVDWLSQQLPNYKKSLSQEQKWHLSDRPELAEPVSTEPIALSCKVEAESAYHPRAYL